MTRRRYETTCGRMIQVVSQDENACRVVVCDTCQTITSQKGTRVVSEEACVRCGSEQKAFWGRPAIVYVTEGGPNE